MRLAGYLRNFAFFLTFLSPAFGLSAAEESDSIPALQGSIARNAHFEVVGSDMLSAQYAAMSGEILVERFSRILVPLERGMQPVLVDLVPASEFEWDSSFITRIYPAGQVKVSISWGESTSRELLERALAQGYLTRLAAVHTMGEVTVPLWLELACQHLLRAQAVTSHRRFLAAQMEDSRPMRLESILLAERGDGVSAELEASSYWLLTFLEREGRGQGQLQNFLIRLFRGEAPLFAMNAAFGAHLGSALDAEMWWLVGLHELLRSPSLPVLSMDESRRRIAKFSRFTFRVGEGEERSFVEDLWAHRASATLQDELQHRARTMRINMSSFHPFYHNALLSLDRVLQMLMAGNEAGYREAIVAFRYDLRAGDELAEDTASILDDLQAELAQ